MFRAVTDLTVAPPHIRAGARFTPVEWRLYADGYDMALVMCLRVMDLAVDRYRHARETRRAQQRAAKSA